MNESEILNAKNINTILNNKQAEKFGLDLIDFAAELEKDYLISLMGFELYYQLKTVRDETEIELAVAKTEMVCYNYTAKKVETIPTSFTNILA